MNQSFSKVYCEFNYILLDFKEVEKKFVKHYIYIGLLQIFAMFIYKISKYIFKVYLQTLKTNFSSIIFIKLKYKSSNIILCKSH